MSKSKKLKDDKTRGTILGIFMHFGRQPDDKKAVFRKAAGLRTADLQIAASSGCLPDKRHWKRIQAAATNNGWKPPANDGLA